MKKSASRENGGPICCPGYRLRIRVFMDKRLGLYIHIPFCASKCGYCDFYSLAGCEKRMLMSLGEPVPKHVYGHGWLIIDGGKMSKSKGNVVDPYMLAERYGVDALRFFLLRTFPFGTDGSFSNELLISTINTDLANDLGNLLSRTTAMRRTVQEVQTDAAYRWFLGLGWQDPVPHFTTFSKNYTRRFKDTDLFEQIFQRILSECFAAKMVDPSVVFVDSTHVKARANGKKYHDEIAQEQALWYSGELAEEIQKDREVHGA